MEIEISKIKDWKIATKNKRIMAKPLVSVMVDKTVTNKFLLDTLEGKEVLGDGSLICVGEAGDAWQQMPKKLLAKYSVVAINDEGWMECEPLPGNATNCVEITSELTDMFLDPNIHDNRQDDGNYYIQADWGEKVNDMTIQRCQKGDFIMQDRENPNDVWIVARKIFLNTYNIKV
jgi:hypothetical protein